MEDIIILLFVAFTVCILMCIANIYDTKPKPIINREYCLEEYWDYYITHVPLKCIGFFDNEIVIWAK